MRARLLIFAAVAGLTAAAASAQSRNPLGPRQIQGLVAGGVDSHRVAVLIQRRGINFTPSDEYLEALRRAGADNDVVEAVRTARRVLSSARKPAVDVKAPEPAAREAPAQPPVTTDSLVRAAHESEQARNWPEAEHDYRSALQADSRNAQLHFSLGRVLEQEHKLDSAIAEYRDAEAIKPGDPDIHRALGLALERDHDSKGAMAEYRRIVALDPSDGESAYKLGLLLYAQGDLGGAVEAYRAAAVHKPNDADIEQKLGLALYVSGDLEGAIAAYREAIRIEPNSAEAHNDLGDALLKKGARLAALEEYRKAFELSPNDSTLLATYPAIIEELQRSASAKPAVQ